ncbi:NAD(P)-dependent alcohol dehydrogenase [Lyngbya confervoides]|uniref:NAD(P)-dependent alcohol dehydrogenase n=1 Tax=Lyngbya confervoides BDU141951 TaxID=1574623 RepID=A0ABD4T0P0_9CYAN|nr:NAD(P)-dependent alcohol dehydrogenase [Lyngbya confervoides]MCM1982277.1 NAD(P)-dependent alcohol dehydrogenase [Lyngbya confervoides BDU141951]
MKAIVQSEYGSPDVLSLAEVETPLVPDQGVLVKVHAASVDAGVWHLMRGMPFLIRLMYGGLRKPKHAILGSAIAGRVEAVGKAVTQFQPGDEVFGDLSESGFGGFAEYACAPEESLALKPNNLNFEEAATIPVSGLAALQALRDVGHLQAGQKVLVLGASGGVGSFAVQIAKALGAEVTGVARTRKAEMVARLGADQVIDYTQTDVTLAGKQYDLILDAAAFRPFSAYLPILTATGTYVVVGGSTGDFLRALALGPFVSKAAGKKVKSLESKPNHADLVALKNLAEAGKLAPFIDRTFLLEEGPAAIRYLEDRNVTGKVAIRV